MNGKCEIVVGESGYGKTTYLLDRISLLKKTGKDYYAWSIDNEFPHTYEDSDEFKTIVQEVSNSFVIFDEATALFSLWGKDKEIIKILIRCRKKNNWSYYVFHSLMDVPDYILRLSQYITLFHTPDEEVKLRRKYSNENIIAAYQQAKTLPPLQYLRIKI